MSLFLNPEDGGNMFVRKVSLSLSLPELQGFTTRKTYSS
jgi:hypothetical protein